MVGMAVEAILFWTEMRARIRAGRDEGWGSNAVSMPSKLVSGFLRDDISSVYRMEQEGTAERSREGATESCGI